MPVNRQKFDQAVALLNKGQYDRAMEQLLTLQRLDPNDPGVANALGKGYAETGRYEQAIYQVERCLSMSPNDHVAAGNLIHMMGLAGKKKESIARAEQLLPRFGRQPDVVLVTAAAYSASGRYLDAKRLLDGFLTNVGVDSALVRYLGTLYLHLGMVPEAVEIYRRSVRMIPGDPTSIGLLAATLNYSAVADPNESIALHREFGRALAAGRPPVDALSFANDPNPERRIRVSIVSPDLRGHPVARFVEAIFKHYSRDRIHMTGIYMYPKDDEVTEQFRGMCDDWRTIRTSKPGIIAEVVAQTKPDVLIELSGLTANSPLFSMSPRLAPVQVSAIGYPHTTGMGEIDYRIVDSITDPPGVADAFATESLVRLDPCFLCYSPLQQPEIRREAGDGVVFGSFNKITKYTDEAFSLWAELLKRTPVSRLLIKTAALDCVDTADVMRRRLEKAGIPRDRVELAGMQDKSEDHLLMYGRIDIALDTFPYNGTTTTCEALLMGVPVITLAGSTHAGRVGASLLNASGMSQWVANSPEQYIEKAVELAKDPEALASRRTEVRRQLLASHLCDAPAYALRWEGAVRQMWRSWCARKAPGA